MPIKQGLKNSLNKIREISSDIYHQYVPIVTDDTNISQFGSAILDSENGLIMNEFVTHLANRIAYQKFEMKYFRNPLQVLEGESIPLGYTGEEIHINPQQGRKYNQEDFAGLLAKYEADVKVQFTGINMDLQYPVTVNKRKLRQAFLSWDTLERFITQFTNSLYNGAYIDEFKFSKMLVSSAYSANRVQIDKIQAPTTAELAKEFITKARQYFLNFQLPSTKYNAWAKIGGYGKPVNTWVESNNIVFLIRNDIRAYIDVNVLANAFNIDKTVLLGNILPIDNFDIHDENGNLVFDGSNIVGMIADKNWFRIKRQDMFLDNFYNPNNTSWQFYLNLIKMYNYSLFANGVVFATEEPQVIINDISFVEKSATVNANEKTIVNVVTAPAEANSPTIKYSSDNNSYFTVQPVAGNPKQCEITGVAEGTANLTAKAGNVQKTLSVTVNQAQTLSAKTSSTNTTSAQLTKNTSKVEGT